MHFSLPSLRRFTSTFLKWVNNDDRTTDFRELFSVENFNSVFDPSTARLFFDSTGVENVVEVVDDFAVFHSSVPNIKLYYPEPFIASPTFAHDDIWFLHIVIYQYWLWFFFIYLIIFFFMTFLITIRWCNVRNRPVRETRGVSRSKCGDLITATVPVSWAASIIIHESTDAIEISDGFGTTEMAVGIRAYQWGWEYYYPKDLDLGGKYAASSFRLGHSLQYNGFTGENTTRNSNKATTVVSDFIDRSKTPTFLLLGSPSSLRQNDVFGANRLISRVGSANMLAPRVLNISNLLKNQILDSTRTQAIMVLYNNFISEDVLTPKPVYFAAQPTFLPTLALFRFSLSFSNFHELNQFFSENSATCSFFSCLPQTFSDISCESFILGNTHTGILKPKFYSELFRNYLPQIERSVFSSANITIFKTSLNPIFTKLSNHARVSSQLSASAWPDFSLIADQDFRRWAGHELLEDLVWTSQLSAETLEPRLQRHLTTSLLPYTPTVLFRDFSSSATPFLDSFTVDSSLLSIATIPPLSLSKFVYGSWIASSMPQSFTFLRTHTSLPVSNVISNYLSTLRPALNSISNQTLMTTYALLINPIEGLTTRPVNSVLASRNFTTSLNTDSFSQTKSDFLMNAKAFAMFNQAFWKVFKSTLEEERTGFNIYNFSRTSSQLPLITQTTPTLLGLFQKNNVSFFSPEMYQSLTPTSLNSVDFHKLWTHFTLPFPFSLSFESDMIRYTWFDWYSRRNLIVTKSIDTSVFSLYGAKQYNYTFTKDPKISLLNKTDNFFVKYAHARKLFVPSYVYTPFFYSKFRDWNLNNSFISLQGSISNLVSFCSLLNIIATTPTAFTNAASLHPFTANFSNTASATRSYFTNATYIHNRMDALSLLFDILTRRDYLIRYLNSSYASSFITANPLYASSVLNPIVVYLKSLNTEPLRLPTRTPFTKVKQYFYNDYKYLLDKDFPSTLTPSSSSLRSTHLPMRKGIVNMIRIHADKAVAMPTDTRLQILAVSKDIIHSWSIPSAGIKIDCIPGYSSHRVVLFTLSGIYWGQCMEICGRFHHWMPIVVYFIRRDLFCVWCVHFVFKNRQINSILQSTDLSYYDVSSAVSLDPQTWAYEL